MRPESLVRTPCVCHAVVIQDEAEMRNYRAFISYNHGDERIARKLHRRIESYRPSKHLKPKPRRLSPVFRDRDEMAAATDLPDKVTTALQNSENLVVLCSPRAAASEWVNREVATFADMHGPDRIFPVIVEGEAPGCFPPALLDATPNPLAADLQDDKDGFADGALKLIAALLPAPYGEVKNREAARARRRARINGGLAGVFALLLVVGSIFAWNWQQELTRAEAAVLAAIRGVDAIVEQVAGGAESGAISTSLANTLLGTAEGIVEEVIEISPDHPKLNEAHGELLVQLARHYARIGDTERAAAVSARAEAALVSASDAGEDTFIAQTMAIEEQGDAAVARGDLVKAMGFYEVIGDLYREKLRSDPKDVSLLRNLSVSLAKVGDVRVAQGDLPGALAVYEEGLVIARDLAARDPGNAGWARDVSVLLNKVGDVRVSQGDLPGALAVYEEGLVIRRDLSARDPGNAGWARDVSVSLERVGDVRVAQGDLPGALSVYEEGLSLRRDLAARDPGNAGWVRDVSVSLNKVGDVRVAQGDLPGALAVYEEGLTIRRDLSARDPGNAGWSRDVVVSCAKLAQANPAEAAKYWAEAVKIVEALDARGALAPVDRWMLERTRTELAAALTK